MSTAQVIQIQNLAVIQGNSSPVPIVLARLPDNLIPVTAEKPAVRPGQDPDESTKEALEQFEKYNEQVMSMPMVFAIKECEVRSAVSEMLYTVYRLYTRDRDTMLVGFEENLPEDYDPIVEIQDTSKATEQPGALYLPKRMRDGEALDVYLLAGMPEKKFDFQTKNSIMEEIVYSEDSSEALERADNLEVENYRNHPTRWRNLESEDRAWVESMV